MKEIERKILNIEVPAFIRKLKKFRPAPTKIFEGLVRVFYFDFPDKRILRKKDLLRLRVIHPKGKKAWTELVYKKYAGVKSGCKYFEEFECVVPGAETAGKLTDFLRCLGLKRVVFYEKKRILYRAGNVKFEIDIHPKIPPFLEIEAHSPQAIDRAVKMLSLERHESSALTISELIKKKYPRLRLDGLIFSKKQL